jgi:nucleoside triphosphate diphosphatase
LLPRVSAGKRAVMTDKKTLDDLRAVMAALRTPVTGCPWDLEQSFETITPYTIEEAYEVADAIERKDLADLREELGDLLLQVVYHARLAEEASAFDLDAVIAGITAKMIRRHPHVFGDATARSAGAAKDFWETIKAEEKAERAAERRRLGIADLKRGSILDDVPKGMTAMTRALKLQAKAARVGFDWPSLAPVFDKMREELAELEVEVAAVPMPSAQTGNTGTAIEEEFGDLLFVMVNVARHLQIDPEAALRRTNTKFLRRFKGVEAALATRGRTPAESTLAEMDQLWDEVKAAEKAAKPTD